MAEPHDRVRRVHLIQPFPTCLLCGEPTVGTIRNDDEPFPPEYPCCPACAYGLDDRELHGLLRVTQCGPS